MYARDLGRRDRAPRKRLLWALAGALLLAGGLSLLATLEPDAPVSNEKQFRFSDGKFSGSLAAALKAEGVSDYASGRIAQALAPRLNLRRLRPDDSYTVVFSTWGAFKYFTLTKDLNSYVVYPSTSGKFPVSVTPVEIKSVASVARGKIQSSLWESMIAAGIAPAVILDYTDVFSWSVDFLTEVRNGDSWALAWNYKTDQSGKIISPKITAAIYEGKETGRKAAAAYEGAYYDESGRPLRNMFLRAPLHYRRISSYFTNRRFHPVLKYFRPHHGIDYAAPSGTPVSAVADGTITFAGWKGGNGKLVIVRHPMGYESTYGHLSRFAGVARIGRRVSQGDVLGYVGSTGLSSGPHLDFRLKQNGRPLNFLKIKHRSIGAVNARAAEAAAAALKALAN